MSVRKIFIVLWAISAIARPGLATLVDWSALTWTPGSLSNSYDVDAGYAGNDVTATISGNTAQLQPSLVTGNPQTPAITRAFDGGLGTSPHTLELALNLTSNAQYVTFTLDFSALYTTGVANVSFTLFDIDFSNSSGNTYQDVISSIQATSVGGTQIAPTITGVGGNVALTGTGLSQVLTGQTSTVDLGAGSGAGNATITFNATDIASITFTYSSSALFADPTYQHIGIYNIDYSVVPEPGTLGACVAIAMLAVWRAHRRPGKS
ncbi:MAG TPA: hypothetical protein VFA58_01720 [Chthoniobacterales bacterium]|nr:hypothetical protein [Chthoniobacterales bacterium]